MFLVSVCITNFLEYINQQLQVKTDILIEELKNDKKQRLSRLSYCCRRNTGAGIYSSPDTYTRASIELHRL